MSYQIGQILYTCNEKTLKIIPFQVVEIIVRKTIDGEKIEHVVQLPDRDKTKTNLSGIKGKVFDNIDDVKNRLIENANNAIQAMITVTNDIVADSFNIQVNQNEKRVQVDANDDIITVDLGNGVKAKMNTSNLDKVVNQ